MRKFSLYEKIDNDTMDEIRDYFKNLDSYNKTDSFNDYDIENLCEEFSNTDNHLSAAEKLEGFFKLLLEKLLTTFPNLKIENSNSGVCIYNPVNHISFDLESIKSDALMRVLYTLWFIDCKSIPYVSRISNSISKKEESHPFDKPIATLSQLERRNKRNSYEYSRMSLADLIEYRPEDKELVSFFADLPLIQLMISDIKKTPWYLPKDSWVSEIKWFYPANVWSCLTAHSIERTVGTNGKYQISFQHIKSEQFFKATPFPDFENLHIQLFLGEYISNYFFFMNIIGFYMNHADSNNEAAAYIAQNAKHSLKLLRMLNINPLIGFSKISLSTQILEYIETSVDYANLCSKYSDVDNFLSFVVDYFSKAFLFFIWFNTPDSTSENRFKSSFVSEISQVARTNLYEIIRSNAYIKSAVERICTTTTSSHGATLDLAVAELLKSEIIVLSDLKGLYNPQIAPHIMVGVDDNNHILWENAPPKN